MAFCRFESNICIVLDSDGILELQYLGLDGGDPLQDLRRAHEPDEPLDGASGEPGGVGPRIRLEQDGVASLGDLLLGDLEVGDEGVEQAGGDLLLPPIHHHNQITPGAGGGELERRRIQAHLRPHRRRRRRGWG